MSNLLSANEIVTGAKPCPKIKPQVYFLIDKQEIVYVGSSIQFGGRLVQHLRGDKIFTHYFLLDCGIDEMEILEYRYINEFKPKYNIKTRPNGDFAPIDRIEKPSGVRKKDFIAFVNSLNLPKNELNHVSKSLVRLAWIDIKGEWLFRQGLPAITKDSSYYEEFIKTGRVKFLENLSKQIQRENMKGGYDEFR